VSSGTLRRINVADPPRPLATTISDVRSGWSHRSLWWTLAYQQLTAAYRRSKLGPFWITIQMTLFTVGIAVIYAGLFGTSFVEFLPFVALGFLFWNLISTTVIDSTSTFTKQRGYIRSTSLPLSSYAYQMVAGHLWTFLHNIVPVVLLLAVLRVVPSPWAVIQTPAALAAILLNGFLLALWLGALSSRYRDLTPFVSSAMQLMMFLTPVFWDPDRLPSRAFIAWNPFAYFLEAARAPLLGQPVRPIVWAVILGITLLNAALAVVVFGRSRRWIAYWVA